MMFNRRSMTIRSRFAAYFAASNKTFAVSFPAAVVLAACLWHLSDSWLWLVPAVTAVIETMAKALEIWNRIRHRAC